ncbi:epoxyqueuosine reductase QueH [Mammaliicoccus stepanovicii]|uniref:Epoxyqueuosine reductase QueH n=1 Tax=Mammaliicoccus stepanovicii TaxID=643214 RepID=A0A239YDW8_9STAP|nr:epoxyqueuosine reductase QueH [Mammaliicoccus stepanovicii]PNZ75531.1 DNA integration/recombination/inversion protein [Mammaliicoccus stepanovicii]GGI42605.1 hypothetical protein GCM10010896_19250 [Mammaliicoccus stepanovicii]SNV56593.1 adenine nucleotide alpha hydrolases superfamily protein [Mammaliicoccus stepanovicii]
MISANEIILKMKNQKINYDKVMRKMISKWEQDEVRPSILIHSCCAPCSTYTLELLTQYADVGIYFANSNIHPKSEYQRRAKVQEAFIKAFNEREHQNVKYIEAPYEPHKFMKMVKDKELSDEEEGGLRCTACFEMRLELVADAADKYGYDYYASALTLSPKKNAQLINDLGLNIQDEFRANYLPSDFKKNKGYERSITLCNDYDIYRQCYCGCVFAAMKQGIDLREVNKQALTFLKNCE